MKETTKKIMALGFAGLAVLGGVTVASAHNGNSDAQGLGDGLGFGKFQGENRFHQGPIFEQSDEITAALESNDYDLFVELTGNNQITETQFADLVERHNLHEDVEAAIENNDYNAWLSAVQKMPNGENMAEIVTSDEFDKFVELHKTQDRVRELRDEIGLNELKQNGFGKRGMKGMRGMAR